MNMHSYSRLAHSHFVLLVPVNQNDMVKGTSTFPTTTYVTFTSAKILMWLSPLALATFPCTFDQDTE
jgi:hypothetical protein